MSQKIMGRRTSLKKIQNEEKIKEKIKSRKIKRTSKTADLFFDKLEKEYNIKDKG